MQRKILFKKSKFRQLVTKNKKILDAGCGAGPFLKVFYKYGYKNLYGIDPGKELVKKIPEKIATIQLGIIQNLPFEDNAFDVVFIFGVLHHLEDWADAVKEVKRVTKREGYIFIIEPARLQWIKIIKIITKILGCFLTTFKILTEIYDEEKPRLYHFARNHLFIKALFKDCEILVNKYFVQNWIFTCKK